MGETASITKLYINTVKRPYSAVSIDIVNACINTMVKSTIHTPTETGSPKYLFKISGGISVPPVEAPSRTTMPIPIPINSPPQIQASNLSSVKMRSPIAIENSPINTG